MPQKTAKIIQSICPITYPLATKIKAVTPISEQAKVRQSLSGTQRKDNATTTSEVIQSILSKMLKSLNGFFSFFIFLSFLLFKGRQRGATQFSDAYQLLVLWLRSKLGKAHHSWWTMPIFVIVEVASEEQRSSAPLISHKKRKHLYVSTKT